MLLWMDRPYFSVCSLPPVPLSLTIPLSLSYPVGSISPSIHLSPPFHVFFTLPPSLAHCPFPLCSGERVPCLLPGSLPALFVSPAVPSFPPISPFPFLYLFSLSSLAFHPFFYFSSLPISLHRSPLTSLCPRHSLHLFLITPPPSLSVPASIHASFFISLSLSFPPPSLSPHLFLAWAQEQRTGVVSF